jgi:hypothetical protein
MDSRLFLHFLSLIYVSQIQMILRDQGLLGKYTTRSVLSELESLALISFSGYGHMKSEISKVQRKILEALNINYEF